MPPMGSPPVRSATAPLRTFRTAAVVLALGARAARQRKRSRSRPLRSAGSSRRPPWRRSG
eukprot:2949045-Prymnesium_polylepis.1